MSNNVSTAIRELSSLIDSFSVRVYIYKKKINDLSALTKILFFFFIIDLNNRVDLLCTKKVVTCF